MNEKKLRYFIITAECQNISKAAERLFIAQPALSKMIAGMEEELGYYLFDRVGKSIILNENGQIFYKYSKRILTEYQNVRDALSEANHGDGELLRIGVGVSSQLLSCLLSQFQKESEIRKQIQIKSTFPLDFEKDEIDLIIDAEAEQTECEEKHSLLCENILLALPKDHPLLKKEEICLKDTMEYAYVLPSENTRMGVILKEFFQKNSYPYPVNATVVNNSYVQCELVALGQGISLIPEKTWPYVNKLKNLRLCPLKDVVLQRHIFFQYHPNRYQSMELKAFGSFLEQFFHRELFQSY